MKSSRITEDLAARALDTMSTDIGRRPAFRLAATRLNKLSMDNATTRRRVVLLNLADDEQAAFWQILSNSTEHFTIISQKESHQRGEYVVRVIFDEHGEDLPITKTQEEFITQYVRNYDV